MNEPEDQEYELDWLGRRAGVEYMANPLPNVMGDDEFTSSMMDMQLYKASGAAYHGRKVGNSNMMLVGAVMMLNAAFYSVQSIFVGMKRSPSSERRVVFNRVLTTAGQRIARRVPRLGALSKLAHCCLADFLCIFH